MPGLSFPRGFLSPRIKIPSITFLIYPHFITSCRLISFCVFWFVLSYLRSIIMKTKDTSSILLKLRAIMSSGSKCEHPLQAVIIPSSDAHQSEYLAPCDLRRSFVSGFTGSAGTAVITQNKAALWTDGRYFLQAAKELDSNWVLMKMGVKSTPSIEDWLCTVLPDQSYVGVNPFLYSAGSWNKMKTALEKKGHKLLETSEDLVDNVWDNRPATPSTPLLLVAPEVSGKSTSEKIQDFREEMTKKDVKWLVVTALDEVAWTFNMRASDIEYNPVFFAYCVIGLDSVNLFIKKSRINEAIRDHLGKAVTIHDYDDIITFLVENCSSEKTWLSTNSSHAIIAAINKKYRILDMYSPVCTTKCVKNSSEIEGMIAANNKDAVALCRYFHWMELNVPIGNVTECSAAAKSLELRKEEDGFVSLSFATISSSGPTGSIIHYSPSPEDDKPVKADQIYLCDSGAQFRDGTTDTTRTVHFSQPSQHERECFTRVLKGHISLASVVFPTGAKGYWLDTLARMHLWKAGLDYRHGTGHGVGSFLNVHEGPVGAYIGCSDRVVSVASDVEVKPGMVITDEPGYYEDGKFGIRIENALLCKKAETQHNFDDKQFLKFESIALVPIQQKMIDRSLLTPDEITWLNNYHQRCRDVIGVMLKKRGYLDTHEWLLEQTKPM